MDTSALIRRLTLINRLSPELQERAVSIARIRSFRPGQIIYREGDSHPDVHFLLRGTVELLWSGRAIRKLTANHRTALRPLDGTTPARYTARSVDDATVAAFERRELDQLVLELGPTSSPRELEVSEIDAILPSNWMVTMLQSELYSQLPPANIQKIISRMERVSYPRGAVVVRQGEVGDAYFVIESGYCEVSRKTSEGRSVHLTDLGPGRGFGEESLVSGAPRSASVTMLSDGTLRRLDQENFVTLILNEVLRPVDVGQALQMHDAGAIWLDVRYPERHAEQAIRGSENIPLSMLRLHHGRLRSESSYIVCGEDAATASTAAFLLVERGYDVRCLDTGIASLLEQHPDLLSSEKGIGRADVVSFPGTELLYEGGPQTPHQGDGLMSDRDQDVPLGNTITRIANLTTAEEAERGAKEKIPPDQYADTMTGKELAGIIEKMSAEQESLVGENTLGAGDEPHRRAPDPAENRGAAPVVDEASGLDADDRAPTDSSQAPPADVPTSVDDEAVMAEISGLVRVMEERLRTRVEEVLLNRKRKLEADYKQRLAQLREVNAREAKMREASIRAACQKEYKGKEQLLRSYYKKLIAVANKISRQKAQLQQARKQFESKLESANRLYREVEEMRALLSENIGYLDNESEEMPQMPNSFLAGSSPSDGDR